MDGGKVVRDVGACRKRGNKEDKDGELEANGGVWLMESQLKQE